MLPAEQTPHLRRRRSAAVLDLPPGVTPARAMETLCEDDRLGLVSFLIDRTDSVGHDGALADGRLDRLIKLCRGLGFDPAECERLEGSMRRSDPQVTASLTKLLLDMLAGAPVLLIRRSTRGSAPLGIPGDLIDAIGNLFGTTIELLRSVEEVRAVAFERPAPRGFTLESDRALYEVLTASDEDLGQRWTDWLASASVDDQDGIVAVASMLQERLHRLGATDAETGRLTGLRRRAWFSNTLMKADSVEIVGRLQEIGIDPVFTGDLPDALQAERSGAVRRILTLSIHVGIDDAVRALELLSAVHEPSQRIPDRPMSWVLRSKLDLRLDAERMLEFRWRWLPERGADRLPLSDGGVDTLEIDGTVVSVLSPTARLIELGAQAATLRPGRALITQTRATELIEHHHDRIDWVHVQQALARLELTEHFGLMLAQMPERVRRLTLLRSQTISPEAMISPAAPLSPMQTSQRDADRI